MSVTALQAQDPIYSQFYLAPSTLNPAFAGNTKGPFLGVNYRNQWPSINNAYSTYTVSYDQIWQKNTGIGLFVTSDDAGDGAIKTTKVAGIYSYKVEVHDDTYFKGALEFGYGQTRLAWEKLVFFDSLDPQFGAESPGGVTIPSAELPRDNLAKGFLDLGAGLMVYNPFWYAGISYKHFNSPSIDFVRDETASDGQLPSRITLHGGLQIDISGDGSRDSYSTFVSPNFLVSKQADFYQMTGGAYINIKRIFGGLWYRHAGRNSDAVIASMGVNTDIFKIGYSYDYTISELTNGSGGAHEIGITVLFDRLESKEYKYSDCFGMFR